MVERFKIILGVNDVLDSNEGFFKARDIADQLFGPGVENKGHTFDTLAQEYIYSFTRPGGEKLQ